MSITTSKTISPELFEYMSDEFFIQAPVSVEDLEDSLDKMRNVKLKKEMTQIMNIIRMEQSLFCQFTKSDTL